MIELKEKHFGFIPNQLFHQDACYFDIIKDGCKSGIYGIINRNSNRAEVFIYIFKEYRYKIIGKNIIKEMMYCPFNYGFKEVWTWTLLKSWVKLLKHFEHEGVKESNSPDWDSDEKKIWFKKEF
jgi:hypothetical protein